MGETLLVAAIAAGLWIAGHETIRGMKKLDHKIAQAFHHKKTPKPQTGN